MITIVRAGIDHVVEIIPLFDAYRQFYGRPSEPDACSEFLTERLLKGDTTLFLALAAGKGVGFVHLFPIFSSVGLKKAWLLNDLFVSENVRNQGVGKKLIEEAQAYTRTVGARFLLLETAEDNTKAQALYEATGFVRSDQRYYYWYATE